MHSVLQLIQSPRGGLGPPQGKGLQPGALDTVPAQTFFTPQPGISETLEKVAQGLSFGPGAQPGGAAGGHCWREGRAPAGAKATALCLHLLPWEQKHTIP